MELRASSALRKALVGEYPPGHPVVKVEWYIKLFLGVHFAAN